MATNGNANAVPFIRNSNLFRKRIMDSLVCWYDIGKQQATNESMAANPVLVDLSGNGHDITCYNFGWSGMSGIGGYFYDSSNLASTSYSKISGNIITITKNEGASAGAQIAARGKVTGKKGEVLTYTAKAVDLKVSNLPEGIDIQIGVGKNNGNETEWETIGYCLNGITHINERVYTIEPYDSESTPYIIDFRILFSRALASVENIADLGITIEILPLYPNALVSDGVDDYCYTDGLPILTDYTVIAKRKWLSVLSNEYKAFSCKGIVSPAFIFERINNDNSYSTFSFGYDKVLDAFEENDISYQSKFYYNKIYLNNSVGTNIDDDKLFILSRNINTHVSQIALYSFLLFDRTLTTAEIEWVKQNMIESGGVLKTDWADSSLWSFYNEANQVRITGTLSSNRMTISSSGMTNPDIPATSNFMEVIVQNSIIPAYKIKVTGLRNGIVLNYVDNIFRLEMSEDGVYNIPEHDAQNRYFGFSFNKTFENENIVIQQLLS